MSFWLALMLLAIGGLAFFARAELEMLRLGPNGTDLLLGQNPQDVAVIATGLAALLLIAPALFGGFRGRRRSPLRDVLVWTMIGLMGGFAYSYRDELGNMAFRIAGEYGPGHAAPLTESQADGERSHRIKRRRDGHFTVNVTINGSSVPMLVDTGASTVVLRQTDARKFGVDTANLRYTVPVQTANGVAYAAHVRLRQASIGSITINGIDALVAQPGVLKESLLGMTFLSRLRSYEFSGQYLTFRN